MSSCKLIAFDFDGTLFFREAGVSNQDRQALVDLGSADLIRVVATGRSLYLFESAVEREFPIDYLVFSSGVGVMRWQDREILSASQFREGVVAHASEYLQTRQLSFAVFEPAPKNHHFCYQLGSNPPNDFQRLLERHDAFSEELKPGMTPSHASQILVFATKDEGLDLLSELDGRFDGARTVRTTSPIDEKGLWIELFPEEVGKSHGIEKVCTYHGLEREHVVAFGNDYNDEDMLAWAGKGYAVPGAPAELMARFGGMEGAFSTAAQFAKHLAEKKRAC